jgi:two-component system LytT family response regulator
MTETTVTRWRAIAIDDEPPALKRLRSLLGGHREIELIGEFNDPEKGIDAIEQFNPDLVFLDIQMPGMTGFDVIKALGTRMPLVVFVTAYDEHAIAAFENQAFDYLLKPLARERFGATIARVVKRLSVDKGAVIDERLHSLLRAFEQHAVSSRVTLRTEGRLRLIDPAEIDWIGVKGNVVEVHTRREVIPFRDTLGALEERLPSGRFVRIQRSVIVNVDRVREIQPWFHGDYVFLLHDGTKLLSGRTYRDRLKAVFGLL